MRGVGLVLCPRGNNIQSGTAIPLAQATDNLKPTLIENSINKLPSMKFDGINDEFSLNASSLANTDYTIFFVGSQDALPGTSHYFLGDPTDTTGNNTKLLLGFDSAGRIVHNQGGTATYSSTQTVGAGQTAILTFTQKSSGTPSKKIYLNGGEIATDSSTTAISATSTLSSLKLGKGFNGKVGEVAIYNKALNTEEIKDINNYLIKKWGSGSASTSSGTISCNAQTVPNVVFPTTTSGATAILTCESGYYKTGTLNALCTGTSWGPQTGGGSCTAGTGCNSQIVSNISYPGTTSGNTATLTCAPAYHLSSGALSALCTGTSWGSTAAVCVADSTVTCSISGRADLILNGSTVPYAASATSLTCASGYFATTLPTYTCTTNGAASITGSCQQNCSIADTTGSSVSFPVSVNGGTSGSLTCGNLGFQNTTYSCSSGAITWTSANKSGVTTNNACTSACTACGCASGYVWDNVTTNCVQAGCPSLIAPSNGVLTYSNGTSTNSIATILCDSGFVQNGAPSIYITHNYGTGSPEIVKEGQKLKCNSTDAWESAVNPSSLPNTVAPCVSKTILLQCYNTRIQVYFRNDIKTYLSFVPSSLVVKCTPGYVPASSYGYASAICYSTSSWNNYVGPCCSDASCSNGNGGTMSIETFTIP